MDVSFPVKVEEKAGKFGSVDIALFRITVVAGMICVSTVLDRPFSTLKTIV